MSNYLLFLSDHLYKSKEKIDWERKERSKAREKLFPRPGRSTQIIERPTASKEQCTMVFRGWKFRN